jgi:hypothetical protein
LPTRDLAIDPVGTYRGVVIEVFGFLELAGQIGQLDRQFRITPISGRDMKVSRWQHFTRQQWDFVQIQDRIALVGDLVIMLIGRADNVSTEIAFDLYPATGNRNQANVERCG